MMLKAKIFSAAMFFFFLTSCTQYQFVRVNSNVKKDSTQTLIVENDTVTIKYSFKGEACPVYIEVFNKLDKPIYINWRKSALILNNKKFSYWLDKSIVSSNTIGSEVKWSKTFSTSSSQTSGTILKDEQITFIPPGSFILAHPLTINTSYFELPPPKREQKISMSDGEDVYKYGFNEENSPLKFRSYLTIAIDENFTSAFHVDNLFWVDEIIQTRANLAKSIGLSSSQFTVSKDTGTGKVGKGCLWAGGLSLVGIMALYNASYPPKK